MGLAELDGVAKAAGAVRPAGFRLHGRGTAAGGRAHGESRDVGDDGIEAARVHGLRRGFSSAVRLPLEGMSGDVPLQALDLRQAGLIESALSERGEPPVRQAGFGADLAPGASAGGELVS